jgi:hypothetical protein
MFSIVTYADGHFDGVDALWREAFPNDNPWNVAGISIPEKIKAQPDLLLVAIQSGSIVGSIMATVAGFRGLRSSNRGDAKASENLLSKRRKSVLRLWVASKSTFRSWRQTQPS